MVVLSRADPPVTTALPAKTPRMPSSELVTLARVVIENPASTALQIRWLGSDVMFKKGVLSQGVVMMNFGFGCAVALLVATPLGGGKGRTKRVARSQR